MSIGSAGFGDTEGESGAALLEQHGPTLYVDIGFDPAFDYAARANRSGVPNSGALQLPALIDTGARDSCIDDALARELGLPLVDRQQIAGVSGPQTHDVYMAHIDVPALAWT